MQVNVMDVVGINQRRNSNIGEMRMCNKVECKWNLNGHQCSNSDVIQKLKEEGTSCKNGLVINGDKVVCDRRVN